MLIIRFINLRVTARCNEECVFCYRGKLSEPELSTEEIKLVIDMLYGQGFKGLRISGGEPLLRKDIVDIVRYAAEKEFVTQLATNGNMLTEQLSRELLDCGLNRLYISLGDMVDYEKLNNFKRNLVNFTIDKLNEVLGGILIITRPMIVDLKKCLNWLADCNVLYLNLIPPKLSADISWFKKNKLTYDDYKTITNILYKYKERFYYEFDCGFKILRQLMNYLNNKRIKDFEKCSYTITINNDGTVLPCCYYKNREKCINIFDVDIFIDIFNTEAFNEFYKVKEKDNKGIFNYPFCMNFELANMEEDLL